FEPRVGPADGAVYDDRYVVGEWGREGFLEELGGPAGFRGLAPAAAQREGLLNMTRARPEQERQGRPRRDDPPAQADNGCGRQRDHLLAKHRQATIIETATDQS